MIIGGLTASCGVSKSICCLRSRMCGEAPPPRQGFELVAARLRSSFVFLAQVSQHEPHDQSPISSSKTQGICVVVCLSTRLGEEDLRFARRVSSKSSGRCSC